MGNKMDPAIAFVTMTLFYRVKDALSFFPTTINWIIQAKVSLNRLVNYLNQPEIEVPDRQDDCTSAAIVCTDAVIGWPSATDEESGEAESDFALQNVDFTLPTGKITLICGPLGSGKTLLVGHASGIIRVLKV